MLTCLLKAPPCSAVRRRRFDFKLHLQAVPSQAERLAVTDAAFTGSSLAVGSLQTALRRVRAEILDPYMQVPAPFHHLGSAPHDFAA